MVTFNLSDLSFILTQIRIAEAHAAGTPLADLVTNPLLPFGLRTVDGTFNNLIPGRETWGSADQPFPRLVPADYDTGTADQTFDINGPAPGGTGVGADYAGGGNVVDTAPRTISNLIVDQTLNNPAAIMAALDYAGITGAAATAARNLIISQFQALAPLETELAQAGTVENAFETALARATNAAGQLETARLSLSTLLAEFGDLDLTITQDDLDAAVALVNAAQAANASANQAVAALLPLSPAPAELAAAQTLAADTAAFLSAVQSINDSLANDLNGQVDAGTVTAAIVAENTLENLAGTQAQPNLGTSDVLVASLTAAESGAQAITEAAQLSLDNAQASLAATLAANDIQMSGGSLVIPNIAPDEGISAPFNSWMTLFGQFFDHGLDLVEKTATTKVYVPLLPDDPLYVEGGQTNFMVITRTEANARNVTTPFVDQNQTYTSHASHQVFLREYAGAPGAALSTGHLLEHATGGLATWADIKTQALEKLGIELTDADIHNVPVLATDLYGEFERGPNGFAQILVETSPGVFTKVEGSAAGVSLAEAVVLAGGGTVALTGHAFINDIAHTAAPELVDPDRNPATNNSVWTTPDDGAGTADAQVVNQFGVRLTYDNELLDAHYVTGDGRGNENIGLTTVHHVFHSEHNRLVEHTKDVAVSSNDVNVLKAWMLGGDAYTAQQVADLQAELDTINGLVGQAKADAIDALGWDGERLFQAARFGTEMQYQHLVFEEFARKINPAVDLFVFNPTMDLDPAIFAEFAHTVYRFGHSMLTEDVARLDATGQNSDDIGLIEAFLNPIEFASADADVMAGAIVRGMTRQVGNEIDEFVTDALRNNLLGLPLDLATVNLARGRETGIPSLQEARAAFYAEAKSEWLKPYTSWVDFAQHLKNPASIVNFVAAYGNHEAILAAATLDDKRKAAMAIVFGDNDGTSNTVLINGTDYDISNRLAFLNGGSGHAGLGGLNDIDLWIGGLAEAILPFGGMLGSTFTFVFEKQLENLQNGDRFYYLSRTQGTHFLQELENNAFSKLVMLNTDLGDGVDVGNGELGHTHLPGEIFSTPEYIIEWHQQLQRAADPEHEDEFLQALEPKVARDQHLTIDGNTYDRSLKFTGGEHVVLGGTEKNDVLIADLGDDTVWGDGGDDYIEGGHGINRLHGGTGDDIIYGGGDPEFLHGDEGNDVIQGGNGLGDLIFGGSGHDFVVAGIDGKEVFAAEGNDFVLGTPDVDFLLGGEGDDWIEGGEGFDTLAGENSELFFNSPIIGHDVLFAGTNENDFDAESGDDIMVQGESVMRNEGMLGFDWVSFEEHTSFGADADMRVRIFTNVANDILRNRFDKVEAMSGSRLADILVGDERASPAGPVDPNLPANEATLDGDQLDREGVLRIRGLAGVLGTTEAAVTALAAKSVVFDAGNILIGGDGSDRIQGNGGNDLIDGDAHLNVRIGIKDAAGNEIGTAEKMQGAVHFYTATEAATLGTGYAAAGAALLAREGAALDALVFVRSINPGNLAIVREILNDTTPDNDIDVAVFRDVRAAYVLTENSDGTWTVDHQGGIDGIDTVRNIEVLRFTDGDFNIANAPPVGQPVIIDPTPTNGLVSPTEGQSLSVTTSGISDPNGVTLPFSFQWQVSTNGGATWADIGGATTASFTPTQAQVGGLLRVQASFTDGGGRIETVLSNPTGVVGDLFIGIPILVNNVFVGTAGDDVATGGAPLIIGGSDTFTGNGGNDTINGLGGTDTAIFNGPVTNFAFGTSNAPLVVTDMTGADGADSLTSIEQLRFGGAGGTTLTVVAGTGAGQTVTGGTGGAVNRADILLGFAGTDILNGNGGNDVLVGGGDNDTVNGGAGDDIILWRAGDGRDFIDGGANATAAGDLVHIAGDATAESFTVYSIAEAALAGFTPTNANTEVIVVRNGVVIAELDNIEELVINGLGVTTPGGASGGTSQGDTITVSGSFAGTSLNFNTITIEGGTGNDTVDITGLTSGHRIVFNSGGGTDTIIGTLRPQDVIQVAPGTDPADYTTTHQGGQTIVSNGTNTITFTGTGTPQIQAAPGDGGEANGFRITSSDLAALKALVNGQQPAGDDDDIPTGVRTLDGHGNNIAHPEFGAAEEPFIRITTPHYGAANPATGNRDINPIFAGLDPRTISNILGTQEADLAPNAKGANIFFMAFGQYFDHGLDFLGKGGNGSISIGGAGYNPATGNPADLTRGTVSGWDGATPEHLNRTSPYVDQNQAYGSHELVGQFLREGNGAGGLGAHLFQGAPDPSNATFALLPTLAELIQHHWANNTVFHSAGLPGGEAAFRDYYAGLVDANGNIDQTIANGLNGNFMGSGQILVGDANPFVNVLDHYVAGDLRTNENVTLTSIHTVWSRNHNYHADNLVAAGFEGSAEELFQAAKILNEAEYQRVVFGEFADMLIGGIKGNGSHGHDDYNPNATASISHEFAAAVYRVGHSLIGQTITVMDESGSPRQVSLIDAFLNPTNEAGAFTGPLPPGYVPQPGFEQLGVDNIIGGIVTQAAEEVDFNLVDAVRNDLVRLHADLFAFNVARGWDVGLGTLNQIRHDLASSTDPYVAEARSHAGNLDPYTSWEDFQARNGLSDTVIDQFKQAYPDLEIAAADIAAFQAINPDIDIAIDGSTGIGTVKGIDRVDVWVGGLAEAHINGGMVGQTFWVVLHEQFDRLQEADRFYYTDRLDNLDLYENFIDGQSFSDIVARNTGLENLPEDIFETEPAEDQDNTAPYAPALIALAASVEGMARIITEAELLAGAGDADGDDLSIVDLAIASGGGSLVANGNGTWTYTPADDDDTGVTFRYKVSDGASTSGAVTATMDLSPVDETASNTDLIGNARKNVLNGSSAGERIFGRGNDDVLRGGGGDDKVYGESGNDRILGGSGDDMLFGGAGDDVVTGGRGDDEIFGGVGDDVLIGQGGTDLLRGGQDNDRLNGGAGADDLWGGSGRDRFVFDDGDTSKTSATRDVIHDFQGAGLVGGDLLDLRNIDAVTGGADSKFDFIAEGTFSAVGQLRVRILDDITIVEGNTKGDTRADFQIELVGRHDLNENDILL
ncbi:MAG: peroxidase family protein [Hyphomicrobiaceae bacterium]